MAEVVKTGLLAGEPLWELREPELVRRCAAYKAAVCLRDPLDRGPRNVLNLGHTFAHALEAAGGYGELEPRARRRARPARGAPAERARRRAGRGACSTRGRSASTASARGRRCSATRRRATGSVRLVLLDAPGRPRWGVEVPEADVRAALDSLIAG